MGVFFKNFRTWFTAIRGYSLPISITSWIVPFLFAGFSDGNILYGILALIGIVFLHAGVNIFDDVIDYYREKLNVDNGLKKSFDFQKGKCSCIFDGLLTFKDYCYASFILFFIPLLIGLYFIFIYGNSLLPILIPTSILCLLYPILGCLGLGEVIVAILFSPLLYLGVFYVMTGFYSLDILLISISTGLLTVAVLHNHMLLDFKLDEKNRKITLCRLCKTERNAFFLLISIVSCAYANIIISVILNTLSPIYLIVLFSIPTAIMLYRTMKTHIETPQSKVKINIFTGPINEIKKVKEEERNFLIKFIIVRNLHSIFTLLICIAIALDKKF